MMCVLVHWSVREGMKEGQFEDLVALEQDYEEFDSKLLRVKEKRKSVTCNICNMDTYNLS